MSIAGRLARTLRGILCLALAVVSGAAAQDTARVALPDTLRAPDRDTVVAGSPSGIDSVVTYTAADSIVYGIPAKSMVMYGKASIRYKELGLKAEHVEVDWNSSTLTARGVADSTDSTGYRGLPVMTEGGDVYNGSTVYYNFKSRKGRIDLGKTEIEKGRYFGQAIKKVGQDVLFVENGRFYTCELDYPHYYFASPEMKVVVKEQVVARPVYLYIADVPVFALPFGVFPSQRGRRSGILTPTFGESSRGRYLRNLGYYWAISDYMDLNMRGDVYSKGGFTLFADARYALRYAFLGGISGSYGRVITGNAGDPDYSEGDVFNVRLSHNQEFDPTMRLVVDMTFTSSSYYQETSLDLNQLLQQNIVSNATLTKFWEGTPLSMTLNYRRDQNLQPQPNVPEITEVLPNIAFAVSQVYPFRSSKYSPGGSSRWYDLLGLTYTGQLLNTRTVTPRAVGSTTDERKGVLHQVNLSFSPKVGYFNITPFLGYVEKWYDRRNNQEVVDSQLVTSLDRGFTAVRYFSTGVSASTKLYGIVQPGLLGVSALRHQLIPAISYTYQPDWSDPRYGYYGVYTDTAGRQVKYDRYAGTAFGGAPSGERQAVSFSLGNVFEMKTAATDTSGRENKYQLLNLGLGISYNLAADSLRFSEVGMDFRTSVADLLSIGGNTRFNLYQWREDPSRPGRGTRWDKFLISEEGRLWDVTAFSISIGTRLSGEKIATRSGPERTEGDSLEAERKRSYVSLYDERAPDFSIPWNLDLTWNFSQNTPDPLTTYKSSTLAAQLGFNLTRAWKISASMNYDILRRQVSAPLITVYRDLHCWELNFSWVPIGQYRNYRLEIRLKSPMLRDLKVTRQGSAAGIY